MAGYLCSFVYRIGFLIVRWLDYIWLAVVNFYTIPFWHTQFTIVIRLDVYIRLTIAIILFAIVCNIAVKTGQPRLIIRIAVDLIQQGYQSLYGVLNPGAV